MKNQPPQSSSSSSFVQSRRCAICFQTERIRSLLWLARNPLISGDGGAPKGYSLLFAHRLLLFFDGGFSVSQSMSIFSFIFLCLLFFPSLLPNDAATIPLPISITSLPLGSCLPASSQLSSLSSLLFYMQRERERERATLQMRSSISVVSIISEGTTAAAAAKSSTFSIAQTRS